MTAKIQNLILLVCTITLIAVPARAQTNINDEGAQHLQTLFQNLLDARAQKDSHITCEGQVTVEPAETYYAVTWPHITLGNPDGEQTEIGLIAMNAAPHDKPGQYKITTALPSPITTQDAEGNRIMAITIGGQNVAGIFDEKLGNFIKMDARLQDVTIILDTGEYVANIPALQLRYDLNEDQGRLSGPSRFEISDFSLTHANGDKPLSIEQLLVTSTIKDLKTELLNTFSTKEEPVKQAPQPLDLADAAGFSISVKNVIAHAPSNMQTKNGFSLQSAALDFGYNDVLSGNASAHIFVNFTGFEANDIPEDLKPLLPETGALQITHHNIPIGALNETMGNSINNTASLLSLPLLLKLPAILADAGSYIEIHDTAFKNKDYDIDLHTALRADSAAINSATMNGTLRFAGLDKTLSHVQVISSAHESYTAKIRDIARILERLKPLARVETDPEKGFVHVFDLEMNKTGEITINGKNATILFDKDAPALNQPAPAPEAPL